MKRLLLAIMTLVSATGTLRAAEMPALRDPSICRGPDGVFYLTGTTKINTLEPGHADFQNNDGIRLWKSPDLKTWTPVGLVWSFAKVPGRGDRTCRGRMGQRHRNCTTSATRSGSRSR
jgi:hypothetical protein